MPPVRSIRVETNEGRRQSLLAGPTGVLLFLDGVHAAAPWLSAIRMAAFSSSVGLRIFS
jgi:hypothetical protein